MLTAPSALEVIATQLPGTDRRSLSQAWYSALHLADHPQAHAGAARMMPGLAATPETHAHASSPGETAGATSRAVATTRGDRSTVHASPSERRAPRTDLARRIERALAPRPRAPIVANASLAITLGEGRVHLLVRTEGTTTRIVALCAPALRESVERALAQARFALAAAGSCASVEAS